MSVKAPASFWSLRCAFYRDMDEITLLSFGYLYGLPEQADTVIDTRGLKNPFYVPELKEKTGLDREVRDYIFSFPETEEYLNAVMQMLRIRLKLFAQWDSPLKHPLMVAVGCTGGRHRSVTMTLALADALRAEGYGVRVIHRDIRKNK